MSSIAEHKTPHHANYAQCGVVLLQKKRLDQRVRCILQSRDVRVYVIVQERTKPKQLLCQLTYALHDSGDHELVIPSHLAEGDDQRDDHLDRERDAQEGRENGTSESQDESLHETSEITTG